MRILGLVFGAVLLLVACGGDEDLGELQPGPDQPGLTAETLAQAAPDGAASDGGVLDGGALTLGPLDFGDFPMPAPPVDGSSQEFNADGLWSQTVTFSADQFEPVVAFYDQWVATQPQQYEKVVAETGGVVYSSAIDNKLHQITISAPIQGDPLTFVTLGIANQ